MRTADSFLQIFDKTNTSISAKSPDLVWCVVETAPDAGIKRLEVDMRSADFVAFDDSLCKNIPRVTSGISSSLKDSECDGIALIRKNDEDIMVFCDLKRSLDTKNIKKGFSQDLLSFIKLHMLLSLCNNYNLAEFKIDFIVTCKCFENEAKRADILLRVQNNQIVDKDYFINSLLYPLIKNGEKCVRLGDFPQIAGLDINPCIKNKNVKLRLLTSNNYADDFVNYRI